MLIPLMLPEALCGTGIRQPVGIHERKEFGVCGGGDDVGNIVVCWGAGAELRVVAVAKIWPGCMLALF